jgi:hypothetical protein
MKASNKSGLKSWAKWLLFFSSYFPLYLIIAVQTRAIEFDFLIFETPVYMIQGYETSLMSIAFIIFGLLVLFFLVVVIWFTRQINGQSKDIKQPERRNELVITYVLVHIVPFAFINYSATLNLIAFLILFLSIGIIQVRSSHLYINPVLAAMRYDFYEIKDAETRGQILLVKTYEDVDSDDSEVAAVELSNGVYITSE